MLAGSIHEDPILDFRFCILLLIPILVLLHPDLHRNDLPHLQIKGKLLHKQGCFNNLRLLQILLENFL